MNPVYVLTKEKHTFNIWEEREEVVAGVTKVIRKLKSMHGDKAIAIKYLRALVEKKPVCL